jgi:hypothetical protein
MFSQLGTDNPDDADKLAALVNDQFKSDKAKSAVSDSAKKFFS